MSDNPRTIRVVGDAVCDHNYYRGNRPTADSSEPLGFRFTTSGGGALLLNEIIQRAINDCPDWSCEYGLDPRYEALPTAYHAYCLWEPQIADPDEKDPTHQHSVWRTVEPPFGYGHAAAHGSLDAATGPQSQPPAGMDSTAPVTGATRWSEILVIDDAGIGFRDGPFQRVWPFGSARNGKGSPRWIVLKVTGSVAEGALWKAVTARFSDQLVLIVSADNLRRADVRISRSLSWEATVEDLTTELRNNPLLRPLLTARHLLVTFGSDGAWWLDNGSRSKASALVFDAARAEGEWAEQQGQGSAFGFLSCFTAAIVRELCRASLEQELDLEPALAAGLAASRQLRRLGHGRVRVTATQKDGSVKEVVNETPGFPLEDIGKRIRGRTNEFVSVPIPPKIRDRGEWTMLDEWHTHARGATRHRPHVEAALAVAVLGAGVLERLPVARFGDLQTVDRKEIESLRTIRQLIRTYEKGGPRKKPLSFGVFGPPGAGKSFGVTQIAKAVLRIDDADILTFNLSQFRDPSDLNGAFHRVRDTVLAGRTPVVFWDEFDAQGYRWLQYLLAPMQDGAFQDGQVTHPIGKSIFVFAGATSPSFEAFGPRKPDDVSGEELRGMLDATAHLRHIEEQWLDFVLKKGPDFKSRLVTYLNVLGPNARQRWAKDKGRRRWEDDPGDVCYPIRRALFIRAQFKLKEGERLRLDPGVVQALLEVPVYRSGARSLEFLCQHLRRDGARAPTRSNLPGRQLLDMHLDATSFWEICERDVEFAAAAADLAQGLHEDWLRALTPEQHATNPNAKPWKDIDPDTRLSNVTQAARIPRVVAAAGLRVVKGPPLSAAEERRVRRTLQDHAEVLAEVEHNLWMAERMLAGWRYGAKKDKERKLHPLLIPYGQLPRQEQEKDRRVIRGQRRAANVPKVEDYVTRVKRIGFRLEATPGTAPARPRRRQG